MADLTPKTIAELPLDTSISGAEIFPIMDGSASKHIPLSALSALFADANVEYIEDANIASGEYTKLKTYRYSQDTLNTPYTEGLTTFTSGVILAYSPANNVSSQFALTNGAAFVCYRRYANGSWISWARIFDTASVIPVENGGTGSASLATARTNLGVRMTKAGYSSATVASNSVITTHIDFPEAFPTGVSNVVACLGSSYGSTAQGFMSNIGISVSGVSNSGFDVQVGYDGTTSITSVNIRWVAVGN